MGAKKQTTRLIKIECPECGWTARTTRQWIEAGLPTCHCGTDLEIPDPDAPERERSKPLIAVFSEPAKRAR